MNGKENSLRSLEARLRSLAADMGVDLEAWRGEGMVVLSPAAEPDFHFPPFALLEKGRGFLLAALLPREVGRRGRVKWTSLPLEVVERGQVSLVLG